MHPNPSVESRTGAVAWALCGITPFPVPAYQTGRADFPHPAFRLASPRGTRRRPKMHASKTQHSESSEDLSVGEPPCAAPLHVVPLAQERTNPIVDVVVDRPIGRHPRSVAKVGRPGEQKPVQPTGHRG